MKADYERTGWRRIGGGRIASMAWCQRLTRSSATEAADRYTGCQVSRNFGETCPHSTMGCGQTDATTPNGCRVHRKSVAFLQHLIGIPQCGCNAPRPILAVSAAIYRSKKRESGSTPIVTGGSVAFFSSAAASRTVHPERHASIERLGWTRNRGASPMLEVTRVARPTSTSVVRQERRPPCTGWRA